MGYSAAELASRVDVPASLVRRLVDLRILRPAADDSFSSGDLRRVKLVCNLERAGVPVEGIAEVMERGKLSLSFLDTSFYERFATLSDVTFQELADQTGVPMELLAALRAAMGLSQPAPSDRVRDDELALAPLIARHLETGSRPRAIQRLLRVYGEATRRIGDSENDWWRTELEEPLLASGMSESEVFETSNRLSDELSDNNEKIVLTLYKAQHEHAAMRNIIEDIEITLEREGIFHRLEHPPAIGFLDITGYTRLTEERGDAAAASLAESLGPLVLDLATRHGGRPIKWLGDGVMLHFPEPGRSALAALRMVERITAAGLPPAHVGLHAGPVLFQEGDYYGRTVNTASRIAAHAQSGQVLVTAELVAQSTVPDVAFDPIGPVTLRGLSEPVQLHVARLAEQQSAPAPGDSRVGWYRIPDSNR